MFRSASWGRKKRSKASKKEKQQRATTTFFFHFVDKEKRMRRKKKRKEIGMERNENDVADLTLVRQEVSFEISCDTYTDADTLAALGLC